MGPLRWSHPLACWTSRAPECHNPLIMVVGQTRGMSTMTLESAVTTSMEPFAPGTVLEDHYRVVRYIGGGGMALVYLVADLRSPAGQVWAMKELRPNLNSPELIPGARAQFKHEARLLQSLEHPGLPKVVEDFTAMGRSCLIMEFIDGTTLQTELEVAQRGGQAGLPEAKVLDWAVQICRVLEYLHGQPEPVIFRDIKPTNVMLTREGKLKLIDFGIARTFKGGQGSDTRVMGTENYAPPEQWGSGQTDARSDVYALGATMYHLLSGKLPPHCFTKSVLSPQLDHPSISRATDDVVRQATEHAPDRRYQTATAMRLAMEAAAAALRELPAMPMDAGHPCPRCGRPNRAAARFCGRCGALMRGRVRAMLALIDQTGQFWEIPLSDRPFLIGRRSSADGIYPDLDLSEYDARFVSRRHAVVVPTEDGPALVDVSHNGTRLNGQRMPQNSPCQLRNGDRIQVGRMELAYHVLPADSGGEVHG